MAKQHMTRRKLLALIIIVAASVAISACAPVGTVPPAAPAATSAPAAATAAPAAATAAPQPMTLQAWISRGAPQGDLLAQMIDKYNAEQEAQGTGIKWEYQSVTDSIDAKLAAAATAGKGFPDAYLGDDSLAWSSRYIQAGWVMPLNDLLDEVGFDWSNFRPNTRWTLDGKDYFLSYGPSGFMQYINLDHAKEAGLDLEKDPPDTLDKMVEWAEAMTKRDASGNVTRSGFLMTGTGLQPTVVWGHVLESLGGSLVAADGKTTNFNNEKGKQAAQFVLDLLNKYKVSDPNVTDRYKEWQTGNGSIFWSGNWVIGSSLPNENLHFDTWRMPAVEGNRAAQASLESMMIFKQDDPARMHEAAKLIKWIFDNFTPYYAQIGDITSWKPVEASAEYQNRPANKFLGPVDQAYTEGFTFPQNSNPVQDLNYYGSSLLIRNLDNVWLGEWTIEEGLNNLDKEVQEVLDQAPLVQFELK
ncbi:MAG: hypothetical protein IT331_13645 [Anaerolineae bacterium]|nr:hypothetical protein [Anaerolineae bacterium]